MIEIGAEELVSLRDVPKLLPAKADGKRIHISAVYRWVQRGIKGVRLEAIHIGGTSYTSREALQRFASPRGGVLAEKTVNYSALRRRQIEAAEKHLDAVLYGGKSRRTGPTSGACSPSESSSR